jgi:nicotinate-nucleotide pyrophosphorylase (carboxylating)
VTELAVLADAGRLAEIALAEDGARDITSEVTAARGTVARGVIEFRSGGVVSGQPYADAVAAAAGLAQPAWHFESGAEVAPDVVLGELRGDLTAMLRAERPLLNLLQRAAGIASLTHRYVAAVAGTGCRILHTRKTAPGLRALDIQAVLDGGGALHRVDLERAVMVKDNHWRALLRAGRSLHEALDAARALGVSALQVEVEQEDQLDLACAAAATRLLVDNQTPETVRRWGERARALRPGIEIEATGGITLENVRRYADAGADFVSVGALTHSVRAADIGLEIEF